MLRIRAWGPAEVGVRCVGRRSTLRTTQRHRIYNLTRQLQPHLGSLGRRWHAKVRIRAAWLAWLGACRESTSRIYKISDVPPPFLERPKQICCTYDQSESVKSIRLLRGVQTPRQLSRYHRHDKRYVSGLPAFISFLLVRYYDPRTVVHQTVSTLVLASPESKQVRMILA